MRIVATYAYALLGGLGCSTFAYATRHDHAHAAHDKRLLLNSLSKSIETTGEHEFQPPTATDARGPCPGLNALANHGRIPRSGIVSLLEAATAINTVYGMSLELSTILSVMGVVWTGNPLSLNPSFSIGGNDTRVQNLLGNVLGLLGTPQGITYSHNLIESDSSPTRNDLFVTGDPATMNITNFQHLYSAVIDSTNQSSAMASFVKQRFDESVATNPHFYYGPFTGFIARNAGYLFALRLLSNHTEEHPEGIITPTTLKSFFAVSGEPGNFSYNRGWERIPEGFVKVPVDWGLVQLNLDLVSWTLQYPVLASIGGNMGEVNTFTGVDLGDPVSGLANVPKLLEGNNLICFALQIVKLAAPSYTNNLFATLAPLNMLLENLAGPLLSLSCPSYDLLTQGGEPLWDVLQAKYSGANNSSL